MIGAYFTLLFKWKVEVTRISRKVMGMETSEF
jgi:hypothetical protein